jgi:hypothetical protein
MPRLSLDELHPVYRKVSHDEAVAIANLGAKVYLEAHDRLFELWTASQSEEEAARVATYRKEGADALLESLQTRLAAGEAAKARVAALQVNIETEVAQRLAAALDSQRKDYEIAKRDALLALEKRVAEADGKQKMYSMLQEAHEGMRSTIQSLQAELAKYKESTSTKSSHALGKMGETEMLDMLNSYVLPRFPYAEVKDMTAVKHATDFHIFIMGPSGQRVKVLLDVKKYSAPIQQCEIEKLYKDVDGDDEAHAGIMVSLDTTIQTKSPFQIAKTKRGRPCMFITFAGLDDGFRQEVLCWALRVLATITSVHDSETTDAMVAQINNFLKDLSVSVTEMEGCVKACKALQEMLRVAKDNLVQRIYTYRVNCGMDVAKPAEEVEVVEGLCAGKTTKGGKCRSRCVVGSQYCVRHNVEAATQ